MTPQQQKTIEWLRAEIMRVDGLGAHQADHEYKEFKITEQPETGLVYLLTVVGQKDDEGTLAAVFARTRRHIKIGKRGSLQLLNAKEGKKVTGYAVTYSATE